ncbi:MAG TPA: FG-GAP repeat protein [Gemmatimonadaceae bacterium]|nr:FG-GAP repeat protein [Gemmatimonadaceae bacterium]
MALAALACLAACGAPGGGLTGSNPAPAGAAGQLPAFVRHVAPFPVTDAGGRLLELAFLGGFNVPRPQLVDVDGDGDLDLFLQEHGNAVMLFVREGDAQGLPRFVLRTEKYGGLDVGEWYRFADVDLDGDLDLLGEMPFSYIRYFRNDGERGGPWFVLAADSLRDTDGTAIFAERQNIAQLGDLDCNGRADLLLGRLDGTVTRYETAEPDDMGVPRFRLVEREFAGIRIVGAQTGGPAPPMTPPQPPPSPPPTMHGANTMALADYDEDGDLDLFWGDFFEAGLLLIENTGSCAEPDFHQQPVQFPVGDPLLTSGYNAPAFGDVNAESPGVELVVGVLGGAFNPTRTAADNLYYLERDSSGTWMVRTTRLLPVLDVGSESVPALVDVDGDGDLDLLLANKIDPEAQGTSRVYLLENIGTRTAPAFVMRDPLPLEGRFHQAPAAGDLDGDGRVDLIVGQWGSSLAWYRGTASGFTLADSAIATISRGSNTMPALGDLDGDGDLDLLVGESSGYLNYFRNDGGPGSPRFTLVTDSLDAIRPGRRSAPALADLDGDGDLDLLVGTEAGEVVPYRNIGTRTTPRFVREAGFEVRVAGYATPAVADLDGDGHPELLVGAAGGGAVYFSVRR